MKIDRSKLKKYLLEPPADCKNFIEKLKNCDRKQLRELLQPITLWHIGKCELYHWIDALDLFDSILEEACLKTGTWMLNCDRKENEELKFLILDILHFTALLIEHSYSRHLYNSIEYLILLLQSSDVHIVLSVLSLLYVFSKRSNFITRLQSEKKQALIARLIYLAETWGGKENGFDLARCCSIRDPSEFPEHAINLHFVYVTQPEPSSGGVQQQISKQIDVPNVHSAGENAAAVMETVLSEHTTLVEDKQIKLFTHLRLAYAFPNFEQRLLCIQARLQALSILVYSIAIQDANNVLYDGLIEELVEVLNVRDTTLTDIKASALKTLTSIIHLERTTKHPPRLQEIIEATQANSYHGFLPTLVRQCIDKLTGPNADRFPQTLSTALFSFLYHMASYETGGEALVNCGIMQALIKVVNYYDESQDFIMFVTRAVRVIDLITTLEVTSFQANNGLQAFINRLEHEVNQCRKEQPFVIRTPKLDTQQSQVSGSDSSHFYQLNSPGTPGEANPSGEQQTSTDMDTQQNISTPVKTTTTNFDGDQQTNDDKFEFTTTAPKLGLSCYHQRAALLKSILNYLKKAFSEPTMVESTRHIMDGSLPNSLKHIISNAEYYGPSLFHLATDVVTSFIFQEPSQLSSLQDNGLTDVLMYALLKKDVPAARDVLASLPNVFSALCLNTRGLENFMECKPFEKLFRVLLSPEYLPAMRRRRGADTAYGTASSLGNAVDELMRHQVSLRTEAMKSIIRLLEQLVEMGNDPKYCCQKSHSSSSSTKTIDTIRITNRATRTAAVNNNDRNAQSSDDEYDLDDEATNDELPINRLVNLHAANNQDQPQTSEQQPTSTRTPLTDSSAVSNLPTANTMTTADSRLQQTITQQHQKEEPIPVPLLDYITNIMRFVEGVISNNTTDDHGKEFVKLGGLIPLLNILHMKNLPIDFPSSQACICAAGLCKSTLTLVKDNKVIELAITNLDEILQSLTSFYQGRQYDGSLLINELAQAVSSSSIDPLDAINQSSSTPLLHRLSFVHSHISLLVSLCKITQNDVRSILISHWGTERGLRVLQNLNKLCVTLIWESSVLLSLCSTTTTLDNSATFNKDDLLKLFPNDVQSTVDSTNVASPSHSVSAQLEELTTSDGARPFEIDEIMSMDTTDFTKCKSKLSQNIQTRIKTIKPLLCVSSKLGRALGELYNLLVRQCSTSQMRHARRFNQPPTIYTPTAAAKQIAATISEVLREGFQFNLQSSPVQHQRFRLTFFVCTIGFATPMLFDERRRPYMLMLQQFESSKAQDALFNALEWTLELITKTNTEMSATAQNDTNNNNNFDTPPTEFLNAALMLIQRLVNVKSVLESPHPIPKKRLPERSYYVPFDPLRYLAETHKRAFHILTNCCTILWDKPSLLKENATKIIDSILSIFCHILRGESIIQKKLLEEETVQAAIAGTTTNTATVPQPIAATDLSDLPGNAASTTVPTPFINEEHVTAIMGMGFSREHAIEGLLQTQGNLELAVDYCVSHPQSGLPQMQALGMDMDADMTRALLLSLGQDVDETTNPAAALATVDQLSPAVETNTISSPITASTIAETTPSGTAITVPTIGVRSSSETVQQENPIEPLSKESVDRFTNSIMLKILDVLPDTVYKMCELVVTTMHRNGSEWRDHFLEIIATDIKSSFKHLMNLLAEYEKADAAATTDENNLDNFLLHTQSSILFSRTLLMSLLFEEMPFPCARITQKYELINDFCLLIEHTTQFLIKFNQKKTPTWLAPTFIFIDLYEKVALASKRRAVIFDRYKGRTRVWQWFDERGMRWNNYPLSTNKIIDEAWANAEMTVKVVVQKRNYLIQFNTMLQSNEETNNKRPIMLTFQPLPVPKPTPPAAAVSNDSATASTTSAADGSNSQSPPAPPPPSFWDTMGSDTSDSSPSDDDDDQQHHERRQRRIKRRATANFNEVPAKKSVFESMDTDQQHQQSTFTSVDSLNDDNALLLTNNCVHLIRLPVDPDAIHALLRLILRLTRSYKYAKQFAQMDGIQSILSLTQASAFQGSASLITLIFRHIMEDDSNLRLAMEKAIRQALTGNHGGSIGVPPGCPGSHESHVLLRILGPAMCRSPDLFIDVASNVMQLVSSGGRGGPINRLTNPLIADDEHTSNISPAVLSTGSYVLQARPATSAPNKPQPTNVAPGTPSAAQPPTTLTTASPFNGSITTANENGNTGELAERLLVDLLDFLLTNDDNGMTTSIDSVSSTAIPPTEDLLQQPTTSETVQVDDTTVQKPDVHALYPKPRRLLSKSTVLRILAELIRSYANVAKLITTKTFSLKNTSATPCSALSYILDHLLPGTNQLLIDQDKDTPALCRLFLVAMAACNHCLESQMNLVNEVKLSLTKAIALPECDEKHVRLQSLSSIINTMIESCPAPNTSTNQPPNQSGHRVTQSVINNMIKIMYKRGLINDLAKMIHSIELSSPKLVETVNAVLKPMETLSRTINYATSLHVPAPRSHNRHTTSATVNFPPNQQTDSTLAGTVTNSNQEEQGTTAVNQNQRLQSQQINNTQQPSVTNDLSTQIETASRVNTDPSHSTSASVLIDSMNINNEQNNPRSNEQLVSGPNALLSISQEELLNATDMEPVASLPQDVDDFDNPNRVRMNVIANESGDLSDDDEEIDDEGENGGTINIEFETEDLGNQQGGSSRFEVWNMPQPTSSSSSGTTNEDENDAEGLESHSDEDDIDMESDNEPEPQHRYSDDDEDLTSEEGDEMRAEVPPAVSTNDDDQDTDTSTDDTNTDAEETAIDVGIETSGPPSTSTAGELPEITADDGANNGDNAAVSVNDGDEVDDDDESFGDDEVHDNEDIEEMVERDLHFNEEDEEEDEDEDDEEEDESTEFEDDENDIVDYVNDVDIDDDMLSEIRNNLLSPGDIEPILLPTNLQGVRIRTTAYPSIHGLTDSAPDPALPPPPMSVPALHPLLVHHSDNQLSSGAFSRFRQLGATNGTTTHLTQQPTNQASFNGATAQVPNVTAATTALTGAAALALQQQQQQQPPRSRTTRTLFVPNSGGILGRAGGFAEYLQQVGQMDVDPFAASGTTTTRILLGSSGHDSETWRFLHDQILMDMAPQANEGNENIDGTKIYTIRTPLARWMEESLVLDGPYVHDTVAALKPKILEPLEKTYDTETQLALAKKQKEEEEKKKRAEEKAASIASTLAAEAQVTTNETTSSSADTTAVQTTESQSETRPPTIIDEIQSQPVLTVQSETQQTVTHDPSIPVTPTSSSVQQQTATTAVTPHDVPATAVTSPIESIVTNQASPSAQNSISILDVVPDSDPVLTNNTPPVITTAEQTSLMDVNPLVPLENTDQTIPPPSTEVSNTQTTTVVPQEEPEVEWQTLVFDGREFRVPRVLEIDPSFLAALPEGMREEIITDQIRNFERQENARRAERAAAAIPSSSTSGATTNGESGTVPPTEDNIPTDVVGEMFGEINPEFIQALPAEIQEELLQERNRTRAVLAAASGTSVDVGPAEFIRTLQPHLRQQVLADMEDSQIAALPDDIALEARRLRQAMETQHSQYLQRNNFLARSQHLMTSMLTSNAHHGTRPIRMYNLRAIQEARNRGERGGTNWYSLSRGGAGAASGTANDTTGLRGRQLLDYESICCLLILLFIDDQHLNFPRLQKVLKNLCHHPPTRAWIIKALLSIMNKSTGKPEFEISSSRTTTTSTTSSPPASNSSLTSTPGAPTLVLNMASDRNRSSLFSSSTVHPTNSNQHQQLQDSQLKLINPSWLTINFDSAFGAKTNVFKIQRLGVKRGGQVQVSVHAQACPVVCRQVIDALIILAKNFPEYFLPLTNSEQQQLALPSHTTSTIVTNDQTKSSTSPEKQVSTIQQTSTVKSLSNRDISFWELLLKLDQTFSSRISSNRQSSITSSTLSSSHTSSTPTQRIISSIAQRPPLPISTPISITTNENDFESCPLAALMCMLDHPILNKNNQLMDKLFKLLSLISQSFYIHITTKKDISSSIPQATSTPLPSNAGTEQNPLTQLQPPIVNGPLTEVVDVAQVPVSDEPNPTQQQPSQSALINNKIIVSDDQVVLGKQLDLVIKALISKSCTEDGLEFATILLLNVSKINLATREKVLHLLLDGIRLLGKNVSKEIRQLHWEVQDYLSKNKSVDDEKTSEQPQHHTSDESSSSSNLFERYNNNRNITHSGSTTTLNATTTASTKQHDLQLPAMIMLTSKTANQQFLLRILKVIIQLREARKKDQLDQQHQFDQEIQVLTRRLDNLRQSLRILSTANTSTETPTTENNVDTLVHETQPIDELGQRLEHMRTRLTTFMNNSNSQHQSILQNHETIHDVQDMRRLLRQLENVVDEFNAPLSNAMTSRLNAALNDIPTNAISITNQASTTETQQPSTTTTTTDAMEIGDQNELSATKKAQLQQSKLSELLNINELWDALSDCLTALSQLPDPHAVLVLQPAVEAFFIVHATDTERETERDDKKKKDRQPNEPMAHLECSGPAASMTQPLDEPQLPTVPIVESEATNTISKPAFVSPTLVLKTPPQPAELPPDAQKFLNFARTHRTVLNQILRQSTQHLSEGPFHILTDYTNILDFDVKRKYFRHELDRLKDNMRGEDLAVHVQRQHVFEDSYRELNRRAPEDWKHRLYIVFDSEEGQDAGGLLREWYSIIAKEMFNPNYALFMINPGDRVTYMPNPLSHCNTNHISYFKFIGRIIAKAIFDNKYMDCYFTRAFYKHILGIPVRYTDMESVDLQFYKSLVLLLENDINTLGLELAFSLDVSEFGVNKTHELIPNGSNIVVTNENKHEYVRLVCQEKMIGSIRQQINAFLDGFYSIIPKSLISIFNEQELELLISGLPDIDIEDLKGNTEYHKYRPNSLQIQWFWRALRSFDKEDLAKFLQFVTGTSKVPLQGFAHLEGMNGPQKFQIHRDDRSTDRLPSAHTCFNQLDLPAYESYDKLRGMLLMAIRECAGFGFA